MNQLFIDLDLSFY